MKTLGKLYKTWNDLHNCAVIKLLIHFWIFYILYYNIFELFWKHLFQNPDLKIHSFHFLHFVCKKKNWSECVNPVSEAKVNNKIKLNRGNSIKFSICRLGEPGMRLPVTLCSPELQILALDSISINIALLVFGSVSEWQIITSLSCIPALLPLRSRASVKSAKQQWLLMKYCTLC